MSFLFASPAVIAAATEDLTEIWSALHQANAVAARSTTNLAAAAA
ncbi:PE domain-containing protein, partial [Mycobacterium kiyosense]